LQIAKNAIGTARPNPAVGAVIVFENRIIGEGFTASYGGNHAEVNAINSVKNKTLLKEATIYVTLEPCAHFGKTPPCADLLVKHQFKNVVIGCVDTNSLVSGKGIERLKNAGINVVVGVLEAECRKHHQRFFTVQEKKRPFIILKWAQTKDGFIYPKLGSESNELDYGVAKPIWISNQYSQQLVHKWRGEEHAILVGTNTVIADNPKLDVRSWSGQNPVRVVLDRNLRIPKDVNVFDGSIKTIVLLARKVEKEKRIAFYNCEESEAICYEEIDFSKNIAQNICTVLQKHKIQSVIIEGGSETLQTFIDANLWDEARIFTGDRVFGKGVKSPRFEAPYFKEVNIKNDVLKIHTND
jgi:diaminohydroxyphosphoribosylaminopyrimidine deaminase/5-amino-6-(5-phosphoribosylamino)uracil reductase